MLLSLRTSREFILLCVYFSPLDNTTSVYSNPNILLGKRGRGIAGEENFPTAYEVPKDTLNKTQMNVTSTSTQSNHREDHCSSQTTDQEATYSVVGPVVDYNEEEGATEYTTKCEEMHYEMVIITFLFKIPKLENYVTM